MADDPKDTALAPLPSPETLLSTNTGAAVSSFADRIAKGAYPIPAWIREVKQPNGAIVKRDPEIVKATVEVIVLRGLSIGTDPFSALEDFYEVKGRLGMTARGMTACVRRHKDCIQFSPGAREEPTADGKGKTIVGYCIVQRRGMDKPMTVEFSWGDAVRAKYPERNSKYNEDPKAMLKARAVSIAARDFFPDALRGMSYSTEELEDIREAEVVPPKEKPPEPPPAGAPATEEKVARKRAPKVKEEAPPVVDAQFTEPEAVPQDAPPADDTASGPML